MKKNLWRFYFYVCTASTSILWGAFIYRSTLEDGYYSPMLTSITFLFALLSMILFILLPYKRLKNHGNFIFFFRPHGFKTIFHISLSMIIFFVFIWATLLGGKYILIQGGLLCIIYPQLLNMNYSYHAPIIITSEGVLQGFFFSSWDKFHHCEFKNDSATISATLNRSDVKHNFKFKVTESEKTKLKLLVANSTNLEVIL